MDTLRLSFQDHGGLSQDDSEGRLLVGGSEPVANSAPYDHVSVSRSTGDDTSPNNAHNGYLGVVPDSKGT